MLTLLMFCNAVYADNMLVNYFKKWVDETRIENAIGKLLLDQFTNDLHSEFQIKEDDKLTLSGASYRKNMADNINAIVMVCEAFNENMYAFTRVKPAIICLLKAGFKHIKEDIYIRRKQNGT